MHACSQALLSAFDEHADSKRAMPMRAYMKDIDVFYGIPSPNRKKLCKHVLAQFPKTILKDWQHIVRDLMNKGKREAMYAAIDIAEKAHIYWDEEAIDILLEMALYRSWWDTIDAISPLIGTYIEKNPNKRDSLIEKWMRSGNFWLQRICLLFQKRYKTRTDKELLFSLCLRLADEKEFFIRKGMGWALREYSYVNPKEVKQFVLSSPLSPLTKKEGLKVIERKHQS
ncbi:MAG: DNA alkylation repair protein [Ignavibacteria bacterium]